MDMRKANDPDHADQNSEGSQDVQEAQVTSFAHTDPEKSGSENRRPSQTWEQPTGWFMFFRPGLPNPNDPAEHLADGTGCLGHGH